MNITSIKLSAAILSLLIILPLMTQSSKSENNGPLVGVRTFVGEKGCTVLFRAFSSGRVEKFDCLDGSWVVVGEHGKPAPPDGTVVGFDAHLLGTKNQAIGPKTRYVLFRWFANGTVQTTGTQPWTDIK